MTLYMWTVYDHPRDYPDLYVARRWAITADGPVRSDDIRGAHLIDTLRDELIDMGLTRIQRADDDDPVIVETWL